MVAVGRRLRVSATAWNSAFLQTTPDAAMGSKDNGDTGAGRSLLFFSADIVLYGIA
jgi:hypothetical protein